MDLLLTCQDYLYTSDRLSLRPKKRLIMIRMNWNGHGRTGETVDEIVSVPGLDLLNF